MAILYNFWVISQFVGGKSLIIFVIFCNSEVFSQARAKGHPAGQNKAAVSSLPKRGLLPIGERGVLLSPRFLIAETRPVVMGRISEAASTGFRGWGAFAKGIENFIITCQRSRMGKSRAHRPEPRAMNRGSVKVKGDKTPPDARQICGDSV